ncbi:hypothetical protein LguiA_031419 [Lonicera macranthoides]
MPKSVCPTFFPFSRFGISGVVFLYLSFCSRDNMDSPDSAAPAQTPSAATTTGPPTSPSSAVDDTFQEDRNLTSVSEEYETTCWGCGLRLLLAPYAPIFKCGWCGAISNQNASKSENSHFWWRRLRDRCLVSVLVIFMLFMIFGGIWAVYPGAFSVSYFLGVSHCCVSVFLSVATLSTFSLSAFRCPGAPPIIPWGSYPIVGKDWELCWSSKSPRLHHLPDFIGDQDIGLLNALFNSEMVSSVVMEILLPFLRSTMFLSTRGLVLAYLFIASVSVLIGLAVLLWQQLCYIYEGKTYLSHLSPDGTDGITKKGQSSKRRLIRISTSEGKWLGSWNTEYIFSLRELQLQDLAEGEDREALVSIKLCIQKHAGFGLSVDGTINFSLTRNCCNCSSPYCRQIDTDFNVWVLPLHRRSDDPDQLPEIGDDDPSLNIGEQNVPSLDKRWSKLLELKKSYG